MVVRYSLFHQIAEPSSARVRRFVTDYGLEDRVRFCNVKLADVAAEFASHGGGNTPALWDGEILTIGAEAVMARLSRLTNIGREP
jgi:hypothetical protein